MLNFKHCVVQEINQTLKMVFMQKKKHKKKSFEECLLKFKLHSFVALSLPLQKKCMHKKSKTVNNKKLIRLHLHCTNSTMSSIFILFFNNKNSIIKST